MLNEKAKRYQKWVYVAYSFYLLLGLAWFIMALSNGGRFNAMALGTIIIFGAQFYYRHLITNLVLGVVFLFLSIFMLLEAINSAAAAAKAHDLLLFDKVIIGLPIVSLLMAGILIFSYTKLGFKD